ncbi:MAG: hypothetical protein J7J20_05535 [Desulfurococcales archaeon]|nr:hypothetical protein [Desulfurococcales archaeon]
MGKAVSGFTIGLSILNYSLLLDEMIRYAVRYTSDGSPMALGSTEPHEVRVKLMNPHQELTPPHKIKSNENHLEVP